MSTYLEDRLQSYDYRYGSGNSLISNAHSDQLEKNLERIYPKPNYYTCKNKLILNSLPKCHLEEFLESLLNKTRIIIEPKIDGCAIGLQFEDGFLTKAISREGKEFTNKLSVIPGVPTKIKVKGLFQVRGELYNPSEYERPTYSQLQASAYLSSADSKSDNLSFCCFQILNAKTNQYNSLKFLEKLGFNIPENYFCNYKSGVKIFRKNWLDKKLFSNYPTDGIVIKINSRKLQLLREKSYGVYPYWQMAIKN